MTTSNTGHGDVLTEDQWLDLAERHAHRDWNCRTPDGYLNSVKALCRDYAALYSASSGAEVLTDARSRVGAFLERYPALRGLHPDIIYTIGDGQGEPLDLRADDLRAILAATQRAEPVAQSGVEGLREALESIAENTCCDRCQEAALVARAALNSAPPAAVQAEPVAWQVRETTIHGWSSWGQSPWIHTGMTEPYESEWEGGKRQFRPVFTRPAAPLSEGLRFVTIDGMAEAFQNEFCPYKGSPDPWIVWRAAWQSALKHASPSPQPTDEATDAGRHQVIRDAARSTGYVTNSQAYDVADAVVAALAARLATPPDNAAGREGVK